MKISKISSYWLCFALIPINIYGDFLEKLTGMPALYYNAASIAVYIALCLITSKIREKVPKVLILFLVLNGIIAIEHIMKFDRLGEEIKHLLYVVLFFMVANYSDQQNFERVKKVILVITIPMTLNALYWYPKIKAMGYRMFNIRRYTMVDKTFYTLLFPIALVILCNVIYFGKSKKKVLYGVWAGILLLIIFAVVESKMAIIAFAVTLGIELFVTRRQHKRRLLKIFLLGVGSISLIGVLILFKVFKVPDYVIAAISVIIGKFDVVNSVYYETFFTRGEILKNGLLVLSRFPVFGIGYGGYYDYVSTHGMQNISTGISDIESAALGVLVEGGIIYFISVLMLYVAIIKNLALKKKIIRNWIDYFGVFTCILLLLIGNDFMSVFYWAIMGILFNGVIRSKRKAIR